MKFCFSFDSHFKRVFPFAKGRCLLIFLNQFLLSPTGRQFPASNEKIPLQEYLQLKNQHLILIIHFTPFGYKTVL